MQFTKLQLSTNPRFWVKISSTTLLSPAFTAANKDWSPSLITPQADSLGMYWFVWRLSSMSSISSMWWVAIIFDFVRHPISSNKAAKTRCTSSLRVAVLSPSSSGLKSRSMIALIPFSSGTTSSHPCAMQKLHNTWTRNERNPCSDQAVINQHKLMAWVKRSWNLLF